MKEKTVACPRAKTDNCDKMFVSVGSANEHVRRVHEKRTFDCPRAGCEKKFRSKAAAIKHAERIHDNPRPRKPGIACPLAKELGCEKTFPSPGNAKRHHDEVHGNVEYSCPTKAETGCKVTFKNKSNVIRHVKNVHGDAPRFDCPYAKEENCFQTFSTQSNADVHSELVHGKKRPGKDFIPAWPEKSPDIPLRDEDGNIIPGWDNLPKPYFLDGVWNCPEPKCNKTMKTDDAVRRHYLVIHRRARWPCPYRTELGCDKLFWSPNSSREHGDRHCPKFRWVCQYPRCLAHMQGRERNRGGAFNHYKKIHVQRGHCRDGEFLPLKVSNKR